MAKQAVKRYERREPTIMVRVRVRGRVRVRVRIRVIVRVPVTATVTVGTVTVGTVTVGAEEKVEFYMSVRVTVCKCFRISQGKIIIRKARYALGKQDTLQEGMVCMGKVTLRSH